MSSTSNPSVECNSYGVRGGTAAGILDNASLAAPSSPSSTDGRERSNGRGKQVSEYCFMHGDMLMKQPLLRTMDPLAEVYKIRTGSGLSQLGFLPGSEANMAEVGTQPPSPPLQTSSELHMHEPEMFYSTKPSLVASQQGGALSIRRSWSKIVGEEENDKPCYLFLAPASGKRQRNSISQEDNFKAYFLASDLVQADLLTIGKLSSSVCQDETSSFTISISKQKVLNSMYDLQTHGVIYYFTGRLLKGYQLHSWDRVALGEGVVTNFIFLGKGFYVPLCAESKFKFMLVEKAGVWGNGHFSMVMPWAGAFDPMQALMHFCPIWITLKEVSPVLLPFISELAAALGKTLYVPNLNSYVMSRNIRICFLWCMKNPIPGRLKVDLGLKEFMYVQVTFNSFPNACYKCHQIGHYAKLCKGPSVVESFNPISEMYEWKEHPHQEGSKKQEDVFVASPIKVFLENKEETAKSCAKQAMENVASTPVLENVLSDTCNLGYVVKPKRKQKRKKRTKKLEEIEENQPLDTLKSEQDKKIDTQAEHSLSERLKNEYKEITTEITVEDEDGDCCVQSTTQEMEREAIDEVKEEQLGRVSSEMHKYYDKVSHNFILPGSYQRKNEQLLLKIEGKVWDGATFFQAHTLVLAEVTLMLVDGTKANFVTY